jgi:hypothetical protein
MDTMTDERQAPITGAPEAAPARPDTREWLSQRISGEVGIVVGVAWYVLFSIAVALEPAATQPEAFPTWLAVGIEVALLGLLAVTAVGLVARRRVGLVASVGASALFLAMVVACPVSGHHGFGAWWYGQMACAIGLVAITGGALRRA